MNKLSLKEFSKYDFDSVCANFMWNKELNSLYKEKVVAFYLKRCLDNKNWVDYSESGLLFRAATMPSVFGSTSNYDKENQKLFFALSELVEDKYFELKTKNCVKQDEYSNEQTYEESFVCATDKLKDFYSSVLCSSEEMGE